MRQTVKSNRFNRSFFWSMFNTTCRVHSDSWQSMEIGLATCNVYHEQVNVFLWKMVPCKNSFLLSHYDLPHHTSFVLEGVTRCRVVEKVEFHLSNEAWSMNGETLAAGCDDGKVYILRGHVRNQELVREAQLRMSESRILTLQHSTVTTWWCKRACVLNNCEALKNVQLHTKIACVL